MCSRNWRILSAANVALGQPRNEAGKGLNAGVTKSDLYFRQYSLGRDGKCTAQGVNLEAGRLEGKLLLISSWERIILGLPVVAVVEMETQRKREIFKNWWLTGCVDGRGGIVLNVSQRDIWWINGWMSRAPYGLHPPKQGGIGWVDVFQGSAETLGTSQGSSLS